MKVFCAHDEVIDLEKLQVHPRNPNTHTDKQIEMLAKIMRVNGVRNPIVVSNRTGFITKGHGRLQAAELNGWKDFPVNFQDYENEALEYADMVADNAIADLSKLDLSLINKEILELGPDFDLDLLGLKNFTVDMNDKELPEITPDFTPKLEITCESEYQQKELFEELKGRGLKVKVLGL